MTLLIGNFKTIVAYLWICGAKSKSTPLSPTIVVPGLLLSSVVVILLFSPKHSNDSPSDSDEHCDDFVDGSLIEIKIIVSLIFKIYSSLKNSFFSNFQQYKFQAY